MTDTEFALSEYEPAEADAMLDALVEADGEEFAERRRGRPRGRTPQRPPGAAEAQRNGAGIKALNERIDALDAKVNKAVAVIARDSAGVRKLGKLVKIDGALDLAGSLITDPTTGQNNIDLFQVLKGSFKVGVFGEPKGALGNPAVIGAIGLLLRRPDILRRFTQSSSGQ